VGSEREIAMLEREIIRPGFLALYQLSYARKNIYSLLRYHTLRQISLVALSTKREGRRKSHH